jgi:hypothetical protein
MKNTRSSYLSRDNYIYSKIRKDKASGTEGIPAELLKCGVRELTKRYIK